MPETMYEYYQQQEVFSTYGGFASCADLEAYEQQRRRLFTEQLCLPPRVFSHAKLIEFGPDTGENSLVFALWGASCTLVEPNPKALPVIREYFQRFDLARQLTRLETMDVARFSRHPLAAEQWEILDAEGFIYTVKPDSLWMDLFSRLVCDEGFVILTYVASGGSFIELLHRVMHAGVRRLTGLSSLEAARALFTAKWQAIPHKRSMESWVMDMLENPFVRLSYFYDPSTLCRRMAQVGLSLYSSWPSYKDGLAVQWFKTPRTAADQLRAQEEVIARSLLSHLFGRTHYLVRRDPSLEAAVAELLVLTDGLIDAWQPERARRCVERLAQLEQALLQPGTVVTQPQDLTQTLHTIHSVQSILHFLVEGKAEELTAFCHRDEAFIRTWGTTQHFAVFQKRTPQERS